MQAYEFMEHYDTRPVPFFPAIFAHQSSDSVTIDQHCCNEQLVIRSKY